MITVFKAPERSRNTYQCTNEFLSICCLSYNSLNNLNPVEAFFNTKFSEERTIAGKCCDGFHSVWLSIFSVCLERQITTGQEWKRNNRTESTVNMNIEAEGGEQTECALGALPRRMTNGYASPWPVLSKIHCRIYRIWVRK